MHMNGTVNYAISNGLVFDWILKLLCFIKSLYVCVCFKKTRLPQKWFKRLYFVYGDYCEYALSFIYTLLGFKTKIY